MAPDEVPEDRRRIAVLIDGDNAQPNLLEAVLEEVAKHGTPNVRRVYGDWTTPQMNGWKKVLINHSFQPVQQFRYTIGKNATDASMIIDAMDILYSGNVEAFALVSSDSDYTRLATRLREDGKFVIGIGERKTPKALVRACNLFVYTENLAETSASTGGKPRRSKKVSKEEEKGLRGMLLRAYEAVESEDGWAQLGSVGNQLHEIDPGFDPRTYGRSKLLDLFRDHPDLFEVRQERKSGPSPVYVRRR